MIQIGIVEPYEIMRKGLTSVIEDRGGMRVVVDASNMSDLFAQMGNTRIDILLLEPILTWGLSMAAVRSAKGKMDNLRILIFSDSTDEEHVQLALRAGVTGFVSKRAKLHELFQALQNLARGEPFLCAEVTAKLTHCIINTLSKQPHELLSDRELQILLLLVNGKTAAEAADELHLSAKTISTHKIRLMQKMEMDSFSKLVQYAATHGLIHETGSLPGK